MSQSDSPHVKETVPATSGVRPTAEAIGAPPIPQCTCCDATRRTGRHPMAFPVPPRTDTSTHTPMRRHGTSRSIPSAAHNLRRFLTWFAGAAAINAAVSGRTIADTPPPEPARVMMLPSAPLSPAQRFAAPTQPSRPPWQVIVDTSVVTSDYVADAPLHTHGLSFPGVSRLPDDLAATFARYPGDLALDSLTSLSPRTAWMLIAPAETRPPRVLSLNGLKALDSRTAGALAEHSGGLSLDGLTRVDLPTARLICKTQGLLSVRGLTGLTIAEAPVFANRTSITLVPPRTTLPPEVQDLLAENPLVRFDGNSDSLPTSPDSRTE